MGKSESQMDIMEKSTKPGKRHWTVAEIGLSVLLLLVSCALTGLIVLYTSALRGRLNPMTEDYSPNQLLNVMPFVK